MTETYVVKARVGVQHSWLPLPAVIQTRIAVSRLVTQPSGVTGYRCWLPLLLRYAVYAVVRGRNSQCDVENKGVV